MLNPTLLSLDQVSLFSEIKSPEAFEQLGTLVEQRSVKADEIVFRKGDTGDELFIIRSGNVSVNVPLDAGHRYHLTTFSDGHFFGDMAFLDRQLRSADAVAVTDTHLFAVSRARFEEFTKSHPTIAVEIMHRLCCELAIRLRYANNELRALHQS